MVLAVLRLKENNVKDLQRKRPFDGRPILRLNSLFDSTILKIPEIGFILCFCIQTSGLEYFGNNYRAGNVPLSNANANVESSIQEGGGTT